MATKTGFIQGFYAAYVSVMAFAQSKNEENPNIDDVMKAVNDQFYIDLTVGQLGKKIDTFYSDESRLKYPIWQVVVYLSGKAWWE
jgi:hypothetical protein